MAAKALRSRSGALLFVYGTLRPCVDIPVSRWLRGVAEHLGEARAPGRLYDLGPYPGLLAPLRRGQWVRGDLYRVLSPRRVFAVLDRYEAGVRGRVRPVFERVASVVERRRTHGGFAPRARRAVAWLYLYCRPVQGSTRIASGDYRAPRR